MRLMQPRECGRMRKEMRRAKEVSFRVMPRTTAMKERLPARFFFFYCCLYFFFFFLQRRHEAEAVRVSPAQRRRAMRWRCDSISSSLPSATFFAAAMSRCAPFCLYRATPLCARLRGVDAARARKRCAHAAKMRDASKRVTQPF